MGPIDVFVRICPLNPLREAMARMVILRWRQIEWANVRYIAAEGSDTTLLEDLSGWKDRAILHMWNFWTASKQLAEDSSRGEFYVLSDDDHLPLRNDFIQEGVEQLQIHREFALLSGWSVGCGPLPPATHGKVIDVGPTGCIGTPYAMRRGTIGKFPPSSISVQDYVMCEQLAKQGWRFGVAIGCPYNHVGEQFRTANECLTRGPRS